MPTYEQLQAEPYWGREVITDELDWLGDELCRRTGRPRGAFGSKGDNHHLRGAHRSQEWIRRSVYCTNRTYTVQDGLTAEQERHIAGVDFTPGSAMEMVAQCRRLLAAMKAGQLNEVREFYGNVDGDQVVDGWNNVLDRAATSDSSHLWHWHLTIDRRHCRNRNLMERIHAVALGEPLEDEMSAEAEEQIAAIHAHVVTGRGADADYALVVGNTATTWVGKTLAAHSSQLAAISAALGQLAGKDFTDEPAIVDGVLTGLGLKPIADIVRALVAAGIDPADLRDEAARAASTPAG